MPRRIGILHLGADRVDALLNGIHPRLSHRHDSRRQRFGFLFQSSPFLFQPFSQLPAAVVCQKNRHQYRHRHADGWQEPASTVARKMLPKTCEARLQWAK